MEATAETVKTITGFKLSTHVKMIIKEIKAKSILSKSQIYDYALNPSIGCGHACVYCYAKFMKRFTGHREPWGDFADIKINAPGAESLVEILAGKVDHVLIDRLNYHYADWAFKKHGMEWAMKDMFFQQKGEELRMDFEKKGIACRKLF